MIPFFALTITFAIQAVAVKSPIGIAQKPSSESIKESYRDALNLIENGQVDEAILNMSDFAKTHPESDWADNAIYWVAQLYLQKGEIELAKAELETLLKLYPTSDRAVRAKRFLKSLKENGSPAFEKDKENEKP